MAIKTNTLEGLGAVANFGSAALLVTLPNSAVAPAQATFKHTGTAGFWVIQYQRNVVGSGPSTTVYSRKLGAGEEFTEDDPPTGEIWALQSGADAAISYYLSWAT